jgi:hypothetical protein
MMHTERTESPGAGTVCQLAADIPSGLNITLTHESKKKRQVYGLQVTKILLFFMNW